MRKYTVEKHNDTRTTYTFTEKNKNGEKIAVEIVEVYPDTKDKHSIVNLWKKHGYTSRVFPSYLSVNTYVTDADGHCWGRYNPTVKRSEDGKRNILDFNWLLEVTGENKKAILAEIERLAFA